MSGPYPPFQGASGNCGSGPEWMNNTTPFDPLGELAGMSQPKGASCSKNCHFVNVLVSTPCCNDCCNSCGSDKGQSRQDTSTCQQGQQGPPPGLTGAYRPSFGSNDYPLNSTMIGQEPGGFSTASSGWQYQEPGGFSTASSGWQYQEPGCFSTAASGWEYQEPTPPCPPPPCPRPCPQHGPPPQVPSCARPSPPPQAPYCGPPSATPQYSSSAHPSASSGTPSFPPPLNDTMPSLSGLESGLVDTSSSQAPVSTPSSSGPSASTTDGSTILEQRIVVQTAASSSNPVSGSEGLSSSVGSTTGQSSPPNSGQSTSCSEPTPPSPCPPPPPPNTSCSSGGTPPPQANPCNATYSVASPQGCQTPQAGACNGTSQSFASPIGCGNNNLQGYCPTPPGPPSGGYSCINDPAYPGCSTPKGSSPCQRPSPPPCSSAGGSYSSSSQGSYPSPCQSPCMPRRLPEPCSPPPQSQCNQSSELYSYSHMYETGSTYTPSKIYDPNASASSGCPSYFAPSSPGCSQGFQRTPPQAIPYNGNYSMQSSMGFQTPPPQYSPCSRAQMPNPQGTPCNAPRPRVQTPNPQRNLCNRGQPPPPQANPCNATYSVQSPQGFQTSPSQAGACNATYSVHSPQGFQTPQAGAYNGTSQSFASPIGCGNNNLQGYCPTPPGPPGGGYSCINDPAYPGCSTPRSPLLVVKVIPSPPRSGPQSCTPPASSPPACPSLQATPPTNWTQGGCS